MRQEQFETMLVDHCAPALMGMKPACLVSFPQEARESLRHMAERYTKAFRRHKIRFQAMDGCGRRCLLLVYRRDLLQQRMADPQVSALLERCGYPAGQPLYALLAHLEKRLDREGDFPHEIGLFLGYPVGDVLGFWQDKGQNCKFCGYWKVYCQEEEAKRCFARFDRCRAYLRCRLGLGKSLLQLAKACEWQAA